jgi:glycosyltransferase involved in cell wall biosynthesis
MSAVRTGVLVQRNAGATTAVAALVARLRRARFVYSSSAPIDFDLGRIERPGNVRLFEWGVRHASEVVVQTDEQAALCRQRFRREPVVIRSIAQPAEPRTLTPDAFLWIGRTTLYKRLDVFLDLAERLPEARFQAVVVPAPGTPEIDARLESARTTLANLEVLEPRPRAELVPLIERAVSIVSTSDFEGMPNVFLEGWARGVPALVYAHDPDDVVARHGLGASAGGSFERLVELARAQWAGRADQAEMAARCLAYLRAHHSEAAVAERWLTQVLGAAESTTERHAATTTSES